MKRIILYLTLYLLSISCQRSQPIGSLIVRAPQSGNYEIYKIAKESPLQFVAEDIGHFNQAISLPTGSYLVMADCSHAMVQISTNETKTLTAHQINFLPSQKVNAGDKFSIQCDRFTKTKSRQNIRNRYTLNILSGKRDVLVGMVPLKLNFSESMVGNSPQIYNFNLSGIRLNSYPSIIPKTMFFVSPSNNLISVTENQEFGHWLYLLPGHYTVEVNGTKKNVLLEDGMNLAINPAFIRISTTEDLNIDLSSNILGSPLSAVLNGNHWLDLNETYPVLPGKGSIKLNNSIGSLPVVFLENQVTHMPAKSITIHSDCPPWDWNCLGQRKVFLYEGNTAYAFAEGITDVPVLYFQDKVWASIQGSRDIRYRISDNNRDTSLNLATVHLKPIHSHRPNQYTDLVRIEAISKNSKGHTLDLPLEREIDIPLIEGRYYLDQYVSFHSTDYERRNHRKILRAKQGTAPIVSYKVYVSDKKLKKILKKKTLKQRKKLQRSAKNNDPIKKSIIPLQIQ